jgi:hypothetical protein
MKAAGYVSLGIAMSLAGAAAGAAVFVGSGALPRAPNAIRSCVSGAISHLA